MIVSYGVLSFQLEKIWKFDCRAVYSEDGVDWLYNHYHIGLQMIFHKQATNSLNVALVATDPDAVMGGGVGPSQQAPGAARILNPELGALSWREVRDYVMQPRRELRVVMGRHVILQAPAIKPDGNQPFVVDCANGPKPISFNIIAAPGSNGKTLIVSWECECWLRDGNHPTLSPTLISHRWASSEHLDEIGLATRTTVGQAVFRKDYMLDHPTRHKPLFADDLRAKLFHPLPGSNYKRISVDVNQSSDGCRYNYTIVDRQQPRQIAPDAGIRMLRGTYTIGWSCTEMFQFANRFITVELDVWGHPNTSTGHLLLTCDRVIANFGFVNSAKPGDGFTKSAPRSYMHAQWQIDLMDRHVKCIVGVRTSDLYGNAWIQWFSSLYDATGRPFPDDLPPVLSQNGPNPVYADVFNGTRSNWAYRLVCQSLSQTDTVPSQPANPQAINNQRAEGRGGY